MYQTNQIVLASNNPHKYKEIQDILTLYPNIELLAANEIIGDIDALDKSEKYDNCLDNAIAKARCARGFTQHPCLADDTGLEVEALGGRPGPLSHRYAKPVKDKTQSEANVEKLLGELKNTPPRSRKARFITCVALSMDGVLLYSTATLEGSIAKEPHGENGFGYDSIFFPEGSDKTFAELSLEEKNTISHRKKAIVRLFEDIRAKRIQLIKSHPSFIHQKMR